MGTLRWLTAGESHGPALVATLEGLPAGVPITSAVVADALARRRLGYGRGARMKFEADEVTVLAGVRHGITLGGLDLLVHQAVLQCELFTGITPAPLAAMRAAGEAALAG